MNKYIHYGNNHFDRNQFKEITNDWTKPKGGLWASPIDAKYSWKDWCEDEQFRDCLEENSFTFTLKEDAKVLHLYSAADAVDLPMSKLHFQSSSWLNPDYELLKKCGVDAVEIHLSDATDPVSEFFTSLRRVLYGWDCDSIVIMNPDIVVEL